MNYFESAFRKIALFFVLLILPLAAQKTFGHVQGENYIFLEFHPDTIDGRFEFRVDELKQKLGVDIFVDGEVSTELLKLKAPQVHEYILNNFSIGPNPEIEYAIKFTQTTLFEGEGGWAQYEFLLETGPTPEELYIDHRLCYENDRMHRGVLVIEKGQWPSDDYEMTISMVFSSNNTVQTLDVQNIPEVMTPVSMIWQGMLHIWIGIDHILFLLALALPIVLVKKGDAWSPAPKLGPALISLLKVITVFTIAHSITLALASLEIFTLPSRLVESVIALSIILVALNNIRGHSHNMSLLIILFLGLFHGLGFASVMADLPFRIAELKNFILMILGFNFGVEIGQLAILVVVFPLLFLMRNSKGYRTLILRGGSAVLVAIATFWFIERAFGL